MSTESVTYSTAPKASGLSGASARVKQSLKKHPKQYGIIAALVVVIAIIIVVVLAVSYKKDKFGTGNLATGSNNPLWQYGSQDAGHGGSVHRTQQPWESRAYGSSADGPHDLGSLGGSAGCGAASRAALDEAGVQQTLQGGPSSGLDAPGLSDDALNSLMHGN